VRMVMSATAGNGMGSSLYSETSIPRRAGNGAKTHYSSIFTHIQLLIPA
jgi:hypothetical protein